MNQISKARIRLMSYFLLCLGLVLISKAYSLQIIHHDDFAERADRQYTRPAQNAFNRGTIYFQTQDGQLVTAASVKTGYLLFISPKTLVDVQKTWEELSKIVPELTQKEFFDKANKKDDPYEELAHRLPEDEANKIQALKIVGLNVSKERWRFYPGLSLASHLLGFVGFDKNNNRVGRYGLERSYEDVLSRSSQNLYVNFFAEIFSNLKQTLTEDKRSEGDVVTTIEPTVQTSLEDMIGGIQKTWNSDQTGAIIMNPKNGEIYAMGVAPSFDPNEFNKEKSVKVFSNPLVESVFEMGSIIKTLTMSAGIDSGKVGANSTYDDKGFVKYDKATVYNYDKKGRGVINMQEVLNHSLNTGMAFAVGQMGKQVFAKYMFDFGLGEKTKIDLPNESESLVSNLKSPRDLEYVTAAFGQGIALTPIATIRALATLGNGGYLVTPHIVKKIIYRSGIEKTISTEKGKQILKPETSTEITRMLIKVVDDALSGGKVKNPDYTVAAKTGTAQIALPNGKGYYEDRYLHSFMGYFPARDPQFVVLIYTVYPKNGAGFASETLTKPFIEMSKFLINYYHVPPDRGDKKIDLGTSTKKVIPVKTP